MQLLSATFHAPARPGDAISLPSVLEKGWSFASLGDAGNGAFHGSGHPQASMLFEGLRQSSAQAGCAISLSGAQTKTMLAHRSGESWAFATLQPSIKGLNEMFLYMVLDALEDEEERSSALALMISAYKQDAPEFVLCNGRESFVYSRAGIFMTRRATSREDGLHASVHLSTLPFGDHLWERLPDGCLLHFVDGCEAGRLDTGLRLDGADRAARQEELIRETSALAARMAEDDRLMSSSYWSG